jgi:glutathione peroxidase-family protein
VEITWLIGMQQKYGPRGFTVVGLAMDDEEEAVVVPFVSKEKFSVNGQQLTMNYPILIGTAEVADKFGGLLGFPTSVLISKDGKVVTTITGIIDEDAMSKKIESELE